MKFGHSARLGQLAFAGILVLASLSVTPAWAQASANERPVPVLTGSAGFFTSVIAGQTALEPQINPVLLVPFSDRFLIESRAEVLGDFERTGAGKATPATKRGRGEGPIWSHVIPDGMNWPGWQS